MFGNIYAGKKVFVSGHTGFKGSWLCAWLISLGAELCGYSNAIPSCPANFDALELSGRMRDLRGDVRDAEKFKNAILDFAPDIIFHLAAQPLVRLSYENPVETFSTNIMGVVNVLESTRFSPSTRALVIITSDKCYRNEEWIWGYRETDRLGGYDPYSASKGCAELVAHSYFRSYFENGAACATTRAGNVIGGGDWAKDRIVPDCARAWADGKSAQIRSPNATRPWQHVLEPLSGYLWLGARLLDNGIAGESCYNPRGESFNFGPPADITRTVGDVARELARFWPRFNFDLARTEDACKKESTLLKLSCDKALAWLDWRATLDFEETIRYTAEWYARYYAQPDKDMWDFTLGQIAAYANAALNRDLVWAKL